MCRDRPRRWRHIFRVIFTVWCSQQWLYERSESGSLQIHTIDGKNIPRLIFMIFSSSRLVSIWVCRVLAQNTKDVLWFRPFGWSYELLLLILCSWHDFSFWFSHILYEAWPQVWYWNKAIHLGDCYKMSVLYWIVFLDLSSCGWNTNFKAYESQWTLYSCLFFVCVCVGVCWHFYSI